MPDRTPAHPAPSAAVTTQGGSVKPADGFADEAEDDGPWRHPPVAPKDDGIATSIGKSISDVVTGPLDDVSGKPKAP